jgi:hypothetical protein
MKRNKLRNFGREIFPISSQIESNQTSVIVLDMVKLTLKISQQPSENQIFFIRNV